ncbi:MAG: hypothetical protein KGQ41_09500, partial [Alphaproteobacteria bacterium]|nr:hypothetical protein [Alphaproteobacteria bacterium]
VRPLAFYKNGSHGLLDGLSQAGQTHLETNLERLENDSLSLAGKETMGWTKRPAFEVLQRWGKLGGKYTDRLTGRDLSHDSRYPHEWACQSIKLIVDRLKDLDNGKTLMENLEEVVLNAQRAILDRGDTYNIDFIGAAGQMCGILPKDLSALWEFDRQYGMPDGAFVKLHKICQDEVLKRGHMPTHLYLDANEERASDLLVRAKVANVGYITIEDEEFRVKADKTSFVSKTLQLGCVHRM